MGQVRGTLAPFALVTTPVRGRGAHTANDNRVSRGPVEDSWGREQCCC